MQSVRTARILAPASLVAAFTAVVLILTGSGTSPQASSAETARPATTRAAPKSHRHFWIVHTGQTLSEIASRTGVPAARIRALNPGKDLDTLQPGERVKVR
jgi:LysM repeat protein